MERPAGRTCFESWAVAPIAGVAVSGDLRLAQNVVIMLLLGAAGWLGYRYILWPDMTEHDTTPLRAAIFGVVMIVLVASAAVLTSNAFIGLFAPIGMARGLLYVADNSGTNSDGLEGVGALLTVMVGIPCVLLVGGLAVMWARLVRHYRMGFDDEPATDDGP